MNDTDPGVQLDALRHREALLEAGQELAGLVTLEWYVDEDRIEWSRSPEFLLGPKPPGGYPLVREMVHPEDRADWLAQRARAMQGECPGAYEYRLVRTDGGLRWVAHVQRTSKVVDGRATQVTVAMLDVTARRTAQDQATRLLRDAVENLEESFSLCDPEGRYLVTNRRFRENNVEIAEHVRIGCRYEDAVRAGVAKGLYLDAIGREEEWLAERLARRRDPHARPVEQRRKGGIWVLARETHLPDGSIITLGLDITEIKRAEQTLREFSAEREALLRLVAENVPVGIAYYDAAGVLRFANRNYLLSMDKDAEADVVGRHVSELFPETLLPEYMPYIERARAGETVRYEATRRIGKQLRTGDNILVPDKAPDGSVQGVFVAMVDVTRRKQATADLAEREALLRLVTENIPIKIIYWDAGGRTLFANPQYARALGKQSVQEVIGKSIPELIPAENWAVHQPYLDRALAGSSVRYEYTPPVGNGNVLDIHLVPDIDGTGLVRGVFATLVDITDLKAAQAEQARALSLLEATFESTADGLLVVSREGRIASFNHRFAQLWRIPEEILASRDDRQALDFVLGQLQDPAAFTARVQELYAHPEAESFDQLEFKDGRVFERYSRPQAVEGAIVGRVWSFRDVTARTRALAELREREAQLRISEARLRDLVDTAPFPIAVRDREGRCLLTNRSNAAIFGLEPAQLIGKTVAEWLAPEVLASVQAAMRRVLETGRMQVDPDYRVVDQHGRQRTFVATRLPYWFSAEHPDCVLSVLAEVTELKAVEEEVRQLNAELEDRVTARTAELAAANRELEAFSYTVSHDLRAPARAVAGFSEILLREHAGQLDEEGVRLLRRMSAAGERMGEMIDGLLRLARVSRAGLVRAPLDLSAMARHVWEEACGSEPGRTVAFVAQAGVNAHADPVLMRNVLQNLLANALKYTRPVKDGRVEFGASASGAELVYFVRDNGVGFDMAHAGKLFGVFQRMHGYDEFEGTGVGLATAQRIIGRHGGRIWADARPGQGACFYFTLS